MTLESINQNVLPSKQPTLVCLSHNLAEITPNLGSSLKKGREHLLQEILSISLKNLLLDSINARN